MKFQNIFIAAAFAEETGDDGTVEETTCLTDELRYYFLSLDDLLLGVKVMENRTKIDNALFLDAEQPLLLFQMFASPSNQLWSMMKIQNLNSKDIP